ncbi:MAG: hypothetical protein AAGJ93_16805 [Bacteroidota bacterium]
MKKALQILYRIYLPLVVVAAVILPIYFGFGVEYVLLGIQATLSSIAWLSSNPFKQKYRSELSLGIVVLFIGILYYATFHLLVLAMSALVLAGWFAFLDKKVEAESNQ